MARDRLQDAPVDQRSEDREAPVVVLLHGWPDSVLGFERVLPLLQDVRVIVPALPGSPHGLPVREPGLTTGGTADLVAGAMHELGIRRVVVSGGGIGSSVAESLAADRPDLVAAAWKQPESFVAGLRSAIALA